MKILIVTVYNSHNSGSFLQAYAMMSVLKKMGNNVKFLKRNTRGSSHDIRKVAKSVLFSLLKFNIGQSFYIIREWFVYDKLQKQFPVVNRNSSFYNETDCVVLGSDTIWNLDSKVLRTQASLYFGRDFLGKHVISYAASAANSKIEVFRNVVTKQGGLSNLEFIMVRDEHTKSLVEQTTNKKAYLVTDPTLIATRDDFESLKYEIKNKKPYVLLYCFGEFSAELILEIQSNARELGCDVISMPINRSWCNSSVMSSPQNMISYFDKAEAVITDTFHGTAFSLIYEKPFAVYDAGKNKVRELLKLYGEENRLFTTPERLKNILREKNTVVSSGRLDIVRNSSIEKLTEALSKISK